jgi:peptidylprolyl isomerase
MVVDGRTGATGCDRGGGYVRYGSGMPNAIRSLIAVVVLSALVAGCGGSSAPSGTAGTSTDTPSASAPTVTGTFGKAATITLPGPTPTGYSATVLTPGKGATVAKGDLLVAHYLGETWRDGKVFDESYKRGQPAQFPIGVGRVIPGWDEKLVGQKIGSRVLLVLPPDKGYGAQGNPQAGIKGTDTLVFVVDIVGAFGATASADGTPVTAVAGLPVVTATAGTKPTITIPKGVAAPKGLVVQPLLQGSGAAVKKGQTLVAQYVGVNYRTGKQFDASWDNGQPAQFPIGVGQVIPGWDTGLVGAKIGSRVLLVIPPADGYGASGNPQAGIKGTDTLVFVVDVLGAL